MRLAKLKITEKSQVDMSLGKEKLSGHVTQKSNVFADKTALQKFSLTMQGSAYCILHNIMQVTAFCMMQMHK